MGWDQGVPWAGNLIYIRLQKPIQPGELQTSFCFSAVLWVGFLLFIFLNHEESGFGFDLGFFFSAIIELFFF